MSEAMRVSGAPPRPQVDYLETQFERSIRARAPRARVAPRVDVRAVASVRKGAQLEAIGKRLDALLREAQGPYTVGGQSVRVTPAFRTRYGESAAQTAAYVRDIKRAVGPKAWRDIAMAAAHATGSRGSLANIKRVTQALLKSPRGEAIVAKFKDDSAKAVRNVMVEFGIGLDCRGYAVHGFLAARSVNGVAVPKAKYGFDAGMTPPHASRHLKGVDIAQARTGDLLRLLPDTQNGNRDHNVVVRSNEAQTAAAGNALRVAGRSVDPGPLRTPGGAPTRLRVLSVDSSWGNARRLPDGGYAPEPTWGGVERRVWVHNPTTGQWGRVSGGRVVETPLGPGNHQQARAYRAIGES